MIIKLFKLLKKEKISNNAGTSFRNLEDIKDL